jgi:cellulose synthase/poly-beta-1,6-N-acetylglucosamine synthase-like glycosyltransferase
LKVRICVPALNEESYIEETLVSLENQLYPGHLYEVVVVLDSRTSDRTASICQQHDCLLLIDDKYHTIGGACFLGFENSDADVLAGTEADTKVSAEWLSLIVADLNASGQCDGVTGPVYAKSECGLRPKFSFILMNYIYRLLGLLLGRSYFHGANYAYRREAYLKAGGFDCKIKSGPDNNLSIRVGKAGGRLKFDRRLRVFTSGRRFDEGYLKCLWEYGKLFWQVNSFKQPERFKHMR